MGVQPSYYKSISDLNGECNIHATVYLALCLKTSVLEVKKCLNRDLYTNVLNDRNILVLFNLLFKFLPEMKSVIKVYCNPSQFSWLNKWINLVATWKLLCVFFIVCREVAVTPEKIIGALYKTRFLAEQLQFPTHYNQSDDLRHKLSNFLVECLNITNRYCRILKCPSKLDMLFICGRNIHAQNVTHGQMLV